MHGKKTLVGQKKVHHREDGFFHQSAIVGRTGNQTNAILEVDDRCAFGKTAVALRVAAIGLNIQHRPAFGLRIFDPVNLLGKHVVGEHRMHRELTDKPVGDRISRVRTGENVLHVK